MHPNTMTTAQLFDLATQGSSGFSQSVYSKAREMPDAVYIAVGSVIGALTALAVVIGECPNEDPHDPAFNPSARINADTMLFGALLAVETTTCADSRKIDSHTSASGQEIEFSAATILSALQSFEKLTGRKPDAKLSRGMVGAARMGAEAATLMLANVLKRKPNAAPGSDSLN